MTRFLAQIILLDVESFNAYTALDRPMADQKFVNRIRCSDGKWFQLLPGQYLLEERIHRQRACFRAQTAAECLNQPFAITVVEVNGMVWTGLKAEQGPQLGKRRRAHG